MTKIGYINLSIKETSSKVIPEDIQRMFLGGRGLGAYLLYNHVEKGGLDPLSGENAVVLSAGFLAGHLADGYGRTNVNAKSFDTGYYGSSSMGGCFAPELKYAGYSSLVIKGKAEKPCYVWINDDEIEIRDASHLWGLDTLETQQRIHEELKDPQVQIITIGKASENLFQQGCVRHQIKRAAGKTGLGVPIGAKLLKAVAVRGSQSLPVKNPQQNVEVAKRILNRVRRIKTYRSYGEVSNLPLFLLSLEQGWLPVKNRTRQEFPEAWGNIDLGVFLDEYREKMLSCQQCSMHCTFRFKIKSGPYAGTWGEGPHWVAQNVWGANIGNNRWDVSLKAQELMDKYGIDCVGFGVYVSWLMELWERGLIDEKQTGGLKYEWGNPDAILGIIEQAGQGVGLGKIISGGADKAIERLGPETAKYFHRCGKNLPQENTNDHFLVATAIGEYTSNRGNDHLAGRATLEHFGMPEIVEQLVGMKVNPDSRAYDTKPAFAIWYQDMLAMCDISGMCKFRSVWVNPLFMGFQDTTDLINSVTGWDLTADEMREVSKRTWNMEKLFNVREGLGREGDIPPQHFFEPLKEGPKKGDHLDRERFEKAIDEYYELRGWDSKTGIPKPETLKKYNLDKEPAHIL